MAPWRRWAVARFFFFFFPRLDMASIGVRLVAGLGPHSTSEVLKFAGFSGNSSFSVCFNPRRARIPKA